MKLYPSEIRYSQDSINNVFDNKSTYRYTYIGETLDDLCEGKSNIEDIPTISVVRKNGQWFTLDNRRLWVFRHLERLRKCTKIPVKQSYSIPDEKFTTNNDGKTIKVRGKKGGRWHKKNTPPKSLADDTARCNWSERQTGLQNGQPPSSNQITRQISQPRISPDERITIRDPEEQDTTLHNHNICSCVIL
ncbi:hypothetical protein ACJMK2_034255 [Sinanodonta woodiana]|uniref:Uncharacterized protein n=1 Tax=Sinanodonta woodiana TaxID=1069815 RepID=A0ABD3WSF8_SINWO